MVIRLFGVRTFQTAILISCLVSFVLLCFELCASFIWCREISPALRGMGNWFLDKGITIIFILFFAWVIIKILKRSLPKLVKTIMFGNSTADEHDEVQKQAQTLTILSTLTELFTLLQNTSLLITLFLKRKLNIRNCFMLVSRGQKLPYTLGVKMI